MTTNQESSARKIHTDDVVLQICVERLIGCYSVLVCENSKRATANGTPQGPQTVVLRSDLCCV